MVAGQFSSLFTWTWLAIFVSCCSRSDAQSGNITLGTKLLPTQTSGWVSSAGNFKLAFYSARSGNVFSVGILYNSITTQTVAWTAGRNAQVEGQDASFELTSDGNLVLSNNSGQPAWRSNTGNLGVKVASMLDDGNLVLYNHSGIVWQSFDFPTDTLLTGQQLPIGGVLKAEGSEYTAPMENGGNLSLTWTTTVYWSSDTASGSANNSPTYASLQGISFGIYNDQNIAVKTWTSSDYTDDSVLFRRLTLDEDGNLRIYSWSSANSDWSVGWQALQDQCEVYGYCGANGLCTYNSTGPTCTCPQEAGYALVDEGNPRNGCKAPSDFVPNCTAIASIVVVNHTLLFTGTNFNAGDVVCQQTCLKNPLCSAATFSGDGSGVCVLVYSGSFTGYQEPNIASRSFFKLCGAAPPGFTASPAANSPTSSSTTSQVVPVIASILGTLGSVVVVQGALFWYCRRKNASFFGSHSTHYDLLEYASGAPIQFSYKELQIATHGFSEKLGEGGFGAVYKGVLPNKTEVAVKQLEGIDQGEKQFRMEVAIIGSTHHMNLVRLCGLCAQSKHRLLVYEFLRNGSLDKYLFDDSEHAPNLDWETRFNVLLGTARGISYLHQECRDTIIHCDIKPENILLDQNFGAKVSDFGLAKLTNAKDRERIVTTVRGTRGYLAPEWRSNLPITAKSDVFSFGVVVLETVSGKRNFDASITSSDRKTFSEWAFQEYFENKRMEGVVDWRVRDNVDWEQLDRALKVAFWCMQVQPSSRPSMSRVIQMLEGTVPVGNPPKPKSFGELPSEEGAIVELLEETSFPLHGTGDNSVSSSELLPVRLHAEERSHSHAHSTSLVANEQRAFGTHTKSAGGMSFL